MFSENKSRIAKILGGVALSMAIATAWWHFFIPDLTPKTKPATVKQIEITQPKIAETSQQTHDEWDGFYPKYFVVPNSLENHTIYGVPRFEQKISVQIGLSSEDLKKNLVHAAWDLLNKKNAKATMIFAYRSDDLERDGGFSAGRCILAPFGDWSKAINKHSKDDLKPDIEIATVYFKNVPMLKPTSNAIVNTNNACLYATDDCDSDYVSMRLRKGTHVMVINGKRDFMPHDFLDIYKVRVNLGKKKTVTGWMNGYELDEAKEEAKSIDNQKTYTVTKKTKRGKKP